MRTGEGKIKRQRSGRGQFAHVTVEVDLAPVKVSIDFECTADYEAWQDGARVGIEFALKTTNLLNAQVIVKKVIGLAVDTNPSIVAAAAAIATWNAIDVTPSPETMNRVEAMIVASRSRGFDSLPIFE